MYKNTKDEKLEVSNVQTTMGILEIRMKVDYEVHPRLHEALYQLTGKFRAEKIRHLAEIGEMLLSGVFGAALVAENGKPTVFIATKPSGSPQEPVIKNERPTIVRHGYFKRRFRYGRN